jgi:hypothetical protein
MRRVRIAVGAELGVAALALLLAGGAFAAAPGLGSVAATDLQGTSAVLVGTVDPEGLSTTYYFEYSSSPGFGGATTTPVSAAGSETAPRPARAAISDLHPNTSYHFRLVATNGSGTATGTQVNFTTTQGFGFLAGATGFSASAHADGGEAAIQAGSHPYQLDLDIGLRQGGEFEGQPGAVFPDGDLRDLHIELPKGLIANPSFADTEVHCRLIDFHTPRLSPFEESRSGEDCPGNTQVGTLELHSSLGSRSFGLFDLEPPPGVMAQFGASPFGSPLVFDVNVHALPGGSYTLSLDATDVPQRLDFSGLELSLWGVPWNPSHDDQRGTCLNEEEPAVGRCKDSIGDPLEFPPKAFLTLPAACSASLAFSATARSWQQPAPVSAGALNRDSKGNPAPLSSCASLAFSPESEAFLTTTKASSSTGYNFRLSNDNTGFLARNLRAPSQTRTAVVSLPPGTTINPSLGAGLGTCTIAQYEAESVSTIQGAACPNASKIGDFTVKTPLFAETLEGAIYLATPYNNPFGNLLTVYLVSRAPQRGVMVKLAGRIDPNPGTGNLVATFDGLPQLPYSDLYLTFRTGQRAPLVTPDACGAATSGVQMIPWAEGVATSSTSHSSQVATGVEGGPCPSGRPPFSPGVYAGGVNSNVNSYTPYFVHLTRKDTEQEITGYSLVLPEGITGKLAGIPFCPDAAIAAARRKSGVAEERSPSCPAASQVGHVETGYGVGSSLTYTNGKIYLAGPTGGQPLSLVVINPATVGPFDLGTVVIRSAFSVNDHTAQLQIDRSASDAIPHILSGVPLHLRDIRIYMDRYQFTHNPSSCAASQLSSTLGGAGTDFSSGADDTSATVSEHFQLLNCLTLGFKPKLGIRLRGPTRRGAYPQLRATFAARGQGDTNLKEITVSLPRSEFLAQNHIKAICSKGQFQAERCPADSAYGSATAYTPLFDDPLKGNVYLRSSAGKLPDLVADLHSGAIRIILEGHIGPTKQGGISAFFAGLPDEPVDRFVMVLNGGKRGLLQNSANICVTPPEATVKALGQTNLGAAFSTVLRGKCGGKGKSHKRRARIATGLQRAGRAWR